MNRREKVYINNHRNTDRRGGEEQPQMIKFTRRDRQEIAGSQITNRKLSTKEVECSTSPFSNEFMSCVFRDDLGTEKEIKNIVFTNFDVPDQKFTTYKESDSGEIVQTVAFNKPSVCEILGHNHIGLTMNCYDATRDKKKDFDPDKQNRDRNRNMGGGY